MNTRPLILVLSTLALSACTIPQGPWTNWMPSRAEGTARKEMVLALTDAHELIRFNAGQPTRILSRTPVSGCLRVTPSLASTTASPVGCCTPSPTGASSTP